LLGEFRMTARIVLRATILFKIPSTINNSRLIAWWVFVRQHF